MDRTEFFSSNIEKIEYVFRRSRASFDGRLPVIVLACLTNKQAATFCLRYSDRQEIQRLLDADVTERAPAVIFPVEANDELLDYLNHSFPECAQVIAARKHSDSFYVLSLEHTHAAVVIHPIPADIQASQTLA